jgi:hypothetical protein
MSIYYLHAVEARTSIFKAGIEEERILLEDSQRICPMGHWANPEKGKQRA